MQTTRTLGLLLALALVAPLGTGCKGDAGADGANGAAGATGATGATGTEGATGATGTEGATGATGTDGTDAVTTGTIAGAVTDGTLHDNLAGVTVALKDAGGTAVGSGATTDANGAYSIADVPLGTVYITFAKQYFTTSTALALGVMAGQTVTVNATLAEAATGKPTVTLAASPAYDVGYGATTTVTATGTDPNGDTLTYTWVNGGTTTPQLGTITPNSPATTATVTMPTVTQAFAARADAYNNPSDPGAFTSGYTIPAKFGLVPIMADTRGTVSVKVTVADGRGQSTTSSSLSIDAASIQTSAKTVAKGSRVFVQAGQAAGLSWSLPTVPSSSTAALKGLTGANPTATDRYVSFVADLPGKYTIKEAGVDCASGKCSIAGYTCDTVANKCTASIDVYADTWAGVITGGDESVADGGVVTPTVVPDTTCTGICHKAGGTAPDSFTPWKASAHATIFAVGITGGSGTSSSSCFTCHTVGFDKGLSNGGFDDVATTASWTWPATRVAGNWKNLITNTPTVAKLANIQCENCHGPQGTAAAHNLSTGRPFKNPRIDFSSELCGTCHASGSGHHNYSEWATSGHATRGLVTGDAIDGTTGVLAPSCGRCHAAQGYVKNVANVSQAVPYAGFMCDVTTKLGSGSQEAGTRMPCDDVTAGNAEAITCTACHDPHGNDNPAQLRVYDSVPYLTAGFGVEGVGSGATCMSCHNSRNGWYLDTTTTPNTYKPYLHEDGATYNGGFPEGSLSSTAGAGYSLGSPHQKEADNLMGRNVYFLGGQLPLVSKHAYVEDTCVGCHMKLNGTYKDSHGAAASLDHTFSLEGVAETLCANCHGPSINPEGVQSALLAQFRAAGQPLATALKNYMGAYVTAATKLYVRPYLPQADGSFKSGPSSGTGSYPELTPALFGHINNMELVNYGGTIYFLATFDAGQGPTWTYGTAGSTPIQSDEVAFRTSYIKSGSSGGKYILQGVRPDGTNNYPDWTNFAKGYWNLVMVGGDRSGGIHNPSFYTEVLRATRNVDFSINTSGKTLP